MRREDCAVCTKKCPCGISKRTAVQGQKNLLNTKNAIAQVSGNRPFIRRRMFKWKTGCSRRKLPKLKSVHAVFRNTSRRNKVGSNDCSQLLIVLQLHLLVLVFAAAFGILFFHAAFVALVPGRPVKAPTNQLIHAIM